MRGFQNYIGINPEFFANSGNMSMRLQCQSRRIITNLCQCLTIASVESTIVPSMSKSTPSKEWVSGAPVKAGVSSSRGMLVSTGKARRGEGDRLYNGRFSPGNSDLDSGALALYA